MPTDHSQDAKDSILYMLGQLTAKVDALLTNQKFHDQRHNDLEARVSVLETDKAKVIGGALVISTVVGLGLNYLL